LLKIKSVFNATRLLRVCSNLLYLVFVVFIVFKNIMKWTNANVEKVCMNSIINRLKDKCFLTNFYLRIIRNASKLDAIKMLLKKHSSASSLIMFSFSKMTLVVKRVNRYLVLISSFLRVEVFFILYIKHIV